MGRIKIHNYERQYEVLIRKLKESDRVSRKNKQIVVKFCDACLLNSMSKARIVRYLNFFSFLFKFFSKDLDKVTKEDVEKIVAVVNARESFSPSTKHDYKVLLKRFYKWLLGNDEEYPLEVKWIKSCIKRHERKLPGDGELIIQEDVDKLIEASDSPRDKAFVSLLYESGCRIGEIGSMRIGSVNFDKYGTVISVSGKTGSRKIRVVNSTPFLMNWVNVHPLKDDKNSPLWLNVWLQNHHKALDYDSLRMMLSRLFKKAGIKKRSNPHLFRHSRATYLANHLTEFQMNQYFGWIQGSDMPATYVHLSGKEVENTILEISGVKSKEAGQKDKPKVKACPRCEAINNFNDVSCSKCSFVLDEKEAVKIEEKRIDDEQMAELARRIIARFSKITPKAGDIIDEEIKKLR